MGFGTFSTGNRKARQGRNPRTKEIMRIPAQTVVRFKPGKAMRDAVNG